MIVFERPKQLCIGTLGDIEIAGTKVLIEGDQARIYQGDWLKNGEPVKSEFLLSAGDVLTFQDKEIRFHGETLSVKGIGGKAIFLKTVIKQEKFAGFPVVRSGPRFSKKPPDQTLDLPVPDKETVSPRPLWRTILSSAASVVALLLFWLYSPSSPFVLLSLVTLIPSLIMGVYNLVANKKKQRKSQKEQEVKMQEALHRVKIEIRQIVQAYQSYWQNSYPSLQKLVEMAVTHDENLYGRQIGDENFLSVVLGEAEQKLPLVIRGESETWPQIRELIQSEQQVLTPVLWQPVKEHLGLTGDHEFIISQAQNIILQLLTQHSYHDLKLLLFASAQDRQVFWDLRWCLHSNAGDASLLSFEDSEALKSELVSVLSQRQKQQKQSLPFLVIFLLDGDGEQYKDLLPWLSVPGLSCAFVMGASYRNQLPQSIDRIFVQTGDQARCESQTGNDSSVTLQPGIPFSKWTRELAVLESVRQAEQSCPQTLSFYDLYKVKEAQDFPFVHYWQQADTRKALAAKLGVTREGETLVLDFHEKAMGPHGLVAGTTGSGKSELLITLILSLAIEYPPEQVGFLLIDYKGATMSDRFEKLPHLLGSITNLDGAQTNRALVSLQAECQRRQKLLRAQAVSHIDDYNPKEKPLPHLLILVDEFAELKKDQPDFISGLVSLARVGRSLGIHLLLATQKPSGVIDEQIWSNSRFRLALRMESESDSREVLGCGDAAALKEPGRAILSVGNKEQFSLFQCACCTLPPKDTRQKVRAWLSNGTYRTLSDGPIRKKGTDLVDKLCEEMSEYYHSYAKQVCAKPWQPPLPEQLVMPCIDQNRVSEIWQLSCAFGLADFPQTQKQEEAVHDFVKAGHFLAVGTTHTGKTTLLSTMLLTLARQNQSDQLQFCLLDFGNGGLRPFSLLNHTIFELREEEPDTEKQLVEFLEAEIRNRRQLLRDNYQQSLSELTSIQKPPAILIAVDGADSLRETNHSNLENTLLKISRDGGSLGLYLLFSLNRPASLRYGFLAGFSARAILPLADASEVVSLLGRTSLSLPEKPGRLLYRQGEVVETQAYLPLLLSQNQSMRLALKETCQALVKYPNHREEGKP
ncbi:MAG: hypothetical protein LBR25_09400 [Erysipelotrichaceae bacterium]|jgi:S-DNA-T family DNA segregation ATPase FtsK/SpoIIIE|nr:hypothetical protein [Erysipelotrichaceae bacterium]